MFRLQIVLGLLLGIRINVFSAEPQVLPSAKLENAALNILMDDSFLDEQRKKIISLINNNWPDNDNPEEGKYLEGDLIIDSLDYTALMSVNIWIRGKVPYELSHHFTKDEINHLLYAFDQYAARTCIRFYPRTTERDYVSFIKSKSGCASNVGRTGGKQTIELAANCFQHGIILHEIMHTLGFLHEQSSYDRDEYVKINYRNIKTGHERNFRKYSAKETSHLNLPYDYGSLTHYRADAFSKNGKPTIEALLQLPAGVRMGQRDDFSYYDLEKINRRYKCVKPNLYRKI